MTHAVTAISTPSMPQQAPPLPPGIVTSLPHSGMTVREFYAMHFQGAVFPLMAGLVLFGWRAAAVILLVILGAAAGIAIWRRVGSRGAQLEYGHGLWCATLLALMLPAHLAASQVPGTSGEMAWPLPLAAGLILAIFLWLLGGVGSGRIHPVVVTYLFVAALFFDLLVPHWSLGRNHLILGDLLNSGPPAAARAQNDAWLARVAPRGMDAERTQSPASEALTLYTSGREKPDRGWLPMQALLRDNLPPLEDLIIGGHPAPIGMGSAIALIIGGLFLLYRGVIDFRIPLIVVLVEFAALLVLPIPSAVSEHTQWHWLAFRRPEIGWAMGITLANYELIASPTLFVAFFLATAGPVRPMARRARVIYAALIGLLSAGLQLFMGASFGPYLALLLASLLTPAMDRWFSPRPLV
jgi:Na+-translocating ferredoxin:NAD+ oxidoreductase RnfD subunit